MKSTLSFKQIIERLLAGETEGLSATETLKIDGNRLIHFKTTIAERWKDKIIINLTPYSLPSVQLQKQICNIVPKDKQIVVRSVPLDHGGSLLEFVDGR